MSRLPPLSSPLLLGFDEMERLIERVGKSGTEGYPPYNIERLQLASPGAAVAGSTAPPQFDLLRITLAVAGFTREQLDITVEDKQLIVRGRQDDDKSRTYLHRGIAARQFVRTFVLADGIEVNAANLADGLLAIDLIRHEPDRSVRRIEITRPRKP